MKKNKSLTKNAILNVTKQLCAIIFPLIAFPYATRTLGSYNYGKVIFSASIISYISLIASLGITDYAIREGARIKNDKKKLNEFSNQVFSINIISMVISYIVLFLLIIFWKKLKGYTILIIVQSATVFFTTIGTDWINSIYEDYKYITIRYIVSQLISLVLMFILVKNSNDFIIYAFVTVLTSIIANVLNYIYIRKKYEIFPKFILNVDFKKHLKPIIILFGTAVSSIIYVNSDITVLGILKNENSVGIYSVSAKIYSVAKQMLNALMIVTIPRISNEIATKTKEEVNERLNEIFSYIIMLTGPASIGLMMLSKNIVIFLSGNEYITAYQSLEILSIALIFAILVTFFVYVILIPFKKEKVAFYATTFSALINLILNFILIPKYGQVAAAITTLISEFITMAIGIIFAMKIINIKVLKPILIGLINSLLTMVICLILVNAELKNLLTIFLGISISGIICLFNMTIFIKRNKLTH